MRRAQLLVAWLLASLPLSYAAACHALDAPELRYEAPRVRALLEQAWSAEAGTSDTAKRDPSKRQARDGFHTPDARQALSLYCQAGLFGSSEGYFRIGRLLLSGPRLVRNVASGRSYLSLAAQLGHERAGDLLEENSADGTPGVAAPDVDTCAGFVKSAG